MAEEEEPIEEPGEGEPEEGEAPTEEPVVKPREEQRGETAGESIYEGESDPNKILREILEKNPDIKQAHVEEVMDWASYSGQLTPGDVVQILTSMKGISANLAQIIGRKYLLALSKEMGVKASPLVFGGIPQQGGLNLPWPAQQAQQLPAYGFQQFPIQVPRQYMNLPRQPMYARGVPQGVTKEEIVKALKEEREEFQRALDEREKRSKEENEKNALMETLNLIRQRMDNLNSRISTIEKDELPKKYGEET